MKYFLNIGENLELKEKLSKIKYKKKTTVSHDTNELYMYFIKKFSDFFRQRIFLYCNSYYQILYIKRIANYMKILIESNINFVEDDIVKIFKLLILFIINLERRRNKKVIDLYESFFQGTFIELNEKYGLKVSYKDSNEIL